MNSNRPFHQTIQTVTPLHQNKRTASNISPSSPHHSSDSDTPDDPQQQRTNDNEDNGFIHHIKPTFLGPVCTSCNCKVATVNILFDISRNSIKNHFTINKCYSGDILMLKSRELEKSLRTSLLHYHKSMRDNPTIASKMIATPFNFIPASKNLPYCVKCGFIGAKLCHVRRHTKSESSQCSESDVRSADHSIMTNEYGFRIPQEVLNTILKGEFFLPIKGRRQWKTTTQQSPTIIITARQEPTTQLPTIPINNTVQQSHTTITNILSTIPNNNQPLTITHPRTRVNESVNSTKATSIPTPQLPTIMNGRYQSTIATITQPVPTSQPFINTNEINLPALPNTNQRLPTSQLHCINSGGNHPRTHQFLPSDDDIMMAVSNNSPYKDTVSLNQFVLSELSHTFHTKEQADSAY